MLKGISEQSFGLKIGGEGEHKSNQNICLKSRIITCGSFNAHLWFSVILAFRPKYIILSIFTAQRIEPSLLTCNWFMYGCFRETKVPHPHQQDSHPSNEVFRGVRRKVGDKAFLVRGFPQQFPSHFSSPP